jgi:hypothetical protein
MMARRIDGASKSWFKGLDRDTDTTRLANDIARASRSLSQHVVRLQSDLVSFVSNLEKMEVKRKKQSTTRRILGWLKHLFNVLASIFEIGSFIAPFLYSVGLGAGLGVSIASRLCRAAAELCDRAAGTSLRMHRKHRSGLMSDRRFHFLT